MKNVKDQVYAKLLLVTENVSDIYPSNWENLPAIQYTEEANDVYRRTDNEEQYAYLRYRIDIWNSKSTSDLAVQVDAKLSELGLVRIKCQDAEDPSGRRHKLMRYEGIMDVNSELVYWEGNR